MLKSDTGVELSIIIPMKNSTSFIKKSLDQLPKDIDKSWEAIYVDDSSSDNSRDYLRSEIVSRKVSSVKLVSSEGSGPGAARNTGLKQARGRYVSFLDIDDEWKSDDLLSLAANATAEVVMYNHERRYPSGYRAINKSSLILSELNNVDVLRFSESRRRLFYNFNVCWNKLCSREFLIKNRIFFCDGIYEDLDWSFSCLSIASKVFVKDAIIYTYVQHERSTLSQKGRKHLDLISAYDRAIKTPPLAHGYFEDIVKSKALKHFVYLLKSSRMSEVDKRIFLSRASLYCHKHFSLREMLAVSSVSILNKLVLYVNSYLAWRFLSMLREVRRCYKCRKG